MSYLILLALICTVVIPAASQPVRTEISSAAAEKPRVEFESPFAGTYPKAALARILLAHRASGEVVPEAAPYTLVIPAGLQVYLDPARTVVVSSGAVLSTDATGYDTLWAATTPDLSTDRAYVLSIVGSPRTVLLTFVVDPTSIRPRLRQAEGPFSAVSLHDALGRRRDSRDRGAGRFPEPSTRRRDREP